MLIQFLKGFLVLHLYYAVSAGTIVLLNKKFKLPDEIFRKALHLISVFSIFAITLPFNSWILSVALTAVFMLEALIGTKLSRLEKSVEVGRKSGEQQKSMLLLHGTYIVIISICWGIYGNKWAAIASVLAWGIGDAMAAIIGKKFGKHKISGRFIEGTKSVEGTLAMFVTSFLTTQIVLFNRTMLTQAWAVFIVIFWIALFATIAELFSKNGKDTFFCPTAAMLGYVILINVVGGI